MEMWELRNISDAHKRNSEKVKAIVYVGQLNFIVSLKFSSPYFLYFKVKGLDWLFFPVLTFFVS